jgi:hypothetical protein
MQRDRKITRRMSGVAHESFHCSCRSTISNSGTSPRVESVGYYCVERGKEDRETCASKTKPVHQRSGLTTV